jgi:proline iminopeptidase
MNRRDFLHASSLSAATLILPSASTAQPALDGPGQSPHDDLNPGGIRLAGIRMIPVVAGKYKVWTKQVGSGPLKVLLLHGGPGFTHDYLEAMEAFLPQAGITMYYYDQLGAGNSDTPDDPTLWTLPRFVSEVEEVRLSLGLDNFVLLGHSWGGILAMEYALNFQQHLRGLVISNMTAGMQSYLKRTAALKEQLLSAELLVKFNALEAAKDYDNPEYQRIVFEKLYTQMICRLSPWPEPVTRTLRLSNQKIYNQMQGKSEFEVTGNLKDWERWDRLHEIKVKALTIGAAHDEMDPEDMRKMAKLMPNAVSAICPNGSHMAMWDDQAVYFQHLLGFLNRI